MESMNDFRAMIDASLNELPGRYIAIELENGRRVEGFITKVKARRIHLSSLANFGVKESIVDFDQIGTMRFIGRRKEKV